MIATREVHIGPIAVGGGHPLVLIGGPCAIEDEKHALMTAERLATIAADKRVPYVYKSSYDKANRSSVNSYRGPGLVEGLRILRKVRETVGVPVLSDVHQVSEVDPAAEVLDVIQIPAFLCRQTDLLLAAAATGKPVNVKKGQFVAPRDMKNVVDKILSKGNEAILLTERGTSFGYNNLVVDMRGLAVLRDLGYPVVFDATHSVQLPGGAGDRSGARSPRHSPRRGRRRTSSIPPRASTATSAWWHVAMSSWRSRTRGRRTKSSRSCRPSSGSACRSCS